MRAKLTLLRILLPTLTARKLWNYLCVRAAYQVAKLTGKPIHWGLPVSLGVEPTTACNLRCPQCISGLRSFTRPTGRLQPGLFQGLIEEMHRNLLFLMLYFQGEPFLNPHFLELVKVAHGHRLYTQASTNGHFLDPKTAAQTVQSGLSHLIVSLDGLTQETYSKYRIEGDLSKVLEGVRNLVAEKKKQHSLTPFIDLQFIVFAHNAHEVAGVKQLSRVLGVNQVSIKSAQVYDYDTAAGQALIPKGKHSRYTQQADGRYYLKKRLPNRCWKLWQGAEVTWDGRVLPCCFDKDAQHEMGRYPNQLFAEIWRGATYKAFRAKLVKQRGQIEMCRNCSEG